MLVSALLETRPIADILSCTPRQSLRAVVQMLADRRIGAMPVVDGAEVVGIVSERDVLYCLAAEGEASLSKTVEQVMTSPVITVDCSTTCDEALAMMTAGRFRHLPVMKDRAMCGFLSIGDLVKARLDEVSLEAEALRDYIRLA